MEGRREVINRGWLPKGVGFLLEVRKRKQLLKGNTVNVCGGEAGAGGGWGGGDRTTEAERWEALSV